MALHRAGLAALEAGARFEQLRIDLVRRVLAELVGARPDELAERGTAVATAIRQLATGPAA